MRVRPIGTLFKEDAMERELLLYRIGWKDSGQRIANVLESALNGIEFAGCDSLEAFGQMDRRRPILFAVKLPPSGMSAECHRLIGWLLEHPHSLEGATGAVIVDGEGEMFTKSEARHLILAASLAGCTFPGRALVEATGSLYNFNIISRIHHTGSMQAYAYSVASMVRRLLEFRMPEHAGEHVVMVHASSRKTSNSLLLWDMVRRGLPGTTEVEEISLRNGAVIDCRGCSYETCLHFGENAECFYGGVIVEKAYPAILRCDTLVLVCPNYNDAVSANLTAFINRLTALFRSNDFSAKRVFALVISGYSGGDIVAEQVLGAMSLNKNFILPPRFALIETANDPRSILDVPDIQQRARAMAEQIAKAE